MAVADIKTAEIVKDNARSANDTGSPEVQVSLLTARINELRPSQPSWLVEDGFTSPSPFGLPQRQRLGTLSRTD